MRRFLSDEQRDHRVEAELEPDGVHLRVRIEGDPTESSAAPLPGGFSVRRGQRTLEAGVAPDGPDAVVVLVEGETFRFGIGRTRPEAGSSPREGAAGPREVRTPMPGKVVRILRQEGDPVEAGDGVLVFEAMKMQNEIRAPASGVLARLRAAAGTPFDGNELLFAVEPRPSP